VHFSGVGAAKLDGRQAKKAKRKALKRIAART
jgi:hypothetical protein